MRTFSGRLIVLLLFYGGFWLLLLYDAALGMWAAVAFLVGKGAVLLGVFVAGQR